MADEAQVSWQDYIAIIIRRRWYFAIPCAVIVVATMVTSLFLTPIYMANALVLIDNPQIINPLMTNMAISTDVDQRLRVVREELLGYTSISRLIDKVGLGEQVATSREREDLVEELRNHISLTITDRGRVVDIRYYDPDPVLAQKVVNTVTDVYVERNVESQTVEAETAIKFIEKELAVYKQKLEDAELAVREFQELYGMEMPVAITLNSQIIDKEVDLAYLLITNTEQHPKVVKRRREIEALKNNRNAEIKRVVLRAVTKGRNPEIYTDLASRLEMAEHGEADGTDPDVQNAREVYQDWVERMDSAVVAGRSSATQGSGSGPVGTGAVDTSPHSSVGSPAVNPSLTSINLLPRKTQEQARLMRDYKIHQETYSKMQERLQLAKITKRFGESEEGTKFKVIEPARVPTLPVFPNFLLFLLGSLAAGITAGSALVFAVEWLDESFQSPDEIQAALSLPVLGNISRIVTQSDLQARSHQVKTWLSLPAHVQRFKRHVVQPVWTRVDQVLLRWGL